MSYQQTAGGLFIPGYVDYVEPKSPREELEEITYKLMEKHLDTVPDKDYLKSLSIDSLVKLQTDLVMYGDKFTEILQEQHRKSLQEVNE